MLRIHSAGTKVFSLGTSAVTLPRKLVDTVSGVLSITSFAQLPIGAGGNIMSVDMTPDGTLFNRTDTHGGYVWDPTKYNGNGGWRLVTTSYTLPLDQLGSGTLAPVSMVASHSNSNIMYMAVRNTLVKTTNRGVTWSPVNQPVGADWTGTQNSDTGKSRNNRLAIDPSNNNHVLYGTQLDGLYRTTDGGQNRAKISNSQLPNGTASYGINCIAFDPTSVVNNNITSKITLAIEGEGIYDSLDGGITWTKDPVGIDMSTGVRHIQYRADGVMFIVGGKAGVVDGYTRMYRRTGTSWVDISPDQSQHITTRGWAAVAIDPFRPERLVAFCSGGLDANGSNVFSYDSGDNWIKPASVVMNYSHNDIPWMSQDLGGGGFMTRNNACFDWSIANKLYLSEGIGVWELDITGSDSAPVITYTPKSRGIEQLVAETVVAVPDATSDQGVAVIVGGWDRGTFRNVDRHSWPDHHYPGRFDSTWSLSVSPGNPQFIAASTANHQDGYGLIFSGWSDDAGASWNQFASLPVHGSAPYSTGNNEPNALNWGYGQLEVGKNPDHMIWVPCYGKQPHYTTDRGASWQPISISGINNSKYNYQDYYVKRRICAADPDMVGRFYMFILNNGIYRTDNAGATWTQISDISYASGFSGGYDYGWNAKLYAPSSGELWFTCGTLSGGGSENKTTPVFRSTDSGANWNQLQITTVNSIGFGPALSGATGSTKTIVAKGYYQGGSDKKFYASIDNGATWSDLGEYPGGIIGGAGHSIAGDTVQPGRFYAAYGGIGWTYFDVNIV